jgi:hypothetical protein
VRREKRLSLLLGVPDNRSACTHRAVVVLTRQSQSWLNPAIRGPLGIHRGAKRRFWFYGADYSLAQQIAYLNRLRKVSEEDLRRCIAGKSLPTEFMGQRRNADHGVPSFGSTGQDFRILQHTSSRLREVGRNYVTRCPSCAEAGHDQSGDNLAIRIDDSRFYKCWAGCTKEMIRKALGCPIPFRQSA